MPKQVIEIGKASRRRRLTFLCYGRPKTGKTAFLATFPRPLIIAHRAENGWETVESMAKVAPQLFYEEDRLPVVWTVANAADMFEALQDAENELGKDPDKFWTIGVDPLTTYAVDYLASMGDTVQKDTRRAYRDLLLHLQYLMTRVHSNIMGAHVVWVCHAKEKSDDGPAGVLIPGQTGTQAPARVSYWLYHEMGAVEGHAQPVIHTYPYGGFPAGGKDFGQLPEPLPYPWFRAIEEALDLEPRTGVTPIRKTVKK